MCYYAYRVISIFVALINESCYDSSVTKQKAVKGLSGRGIQMNEFIEKHLRPGRKKTDQFLLASLLSFLILIGAELFLPLGRLLQGFFESVLGGDQDAAVFLKEYFDFISIWIGMFLVVIVFKANRPMLKAVKYCSPQMGSGGDGSSYMNGNRAGNNLRGFLIGLALGFGCNGFCILMSVLMGDIYLEYSGFKLVPFLLFFLCVFIQSAAEELTDRWYLYQKLRRRYKTPWIAILVNSIVFMLMHVFNPGVSVLALLQIFLVGVLFSLFVYYYNGLWIAMAFHTAWNFTQSIVFGLPNSGIVSAYSVFRLDAASATNGLFYNVNFGVEGSVASNIILLAVCIYILVKNRKKGEHTDIWAEADQAAIEKAAIGSDAPNAGTV